VHLQGLRRWRARRERVAWKLVSDFGRLSGEFLASSARAHGPVDAASFGRLRAYLVGVVLWTCQGRSKTHPAAPVENAPPELDYPTERIAALVDRLLRHLEDTLTGEPEPVGAVTAAG
jgi:hypothetical protein